MDQVLSLFDRTVRADPAPQVGVVVERGGDVVLLTGSFNFINAWSFDEGAAAEAVVAQAAWSRARGEPLIWRAYDRDGPVGLAMHLAAQGFQAQPRGTQMILEVARAHAGDVAGVAVRRVETAEDVDLYVALSRQAFGASDEGAREAFKGRLSDLDLCLFLATIDGKAAGAARLEPLPPFGLLFGGGVTPDARGRGVYRALVAARIEEARRRGLLYLSTEARETSRPILERLGFDPVDQETTWVFTP